MAPGVCTSRRHYIEEHLMVSGESSRTFSRTQNRKYQLNVFILIVPTGYFLLENLMDGIRGWGTIR